MVSDKTESAHRTVVSRSYYSAYNKACEFMAAHFGFVPPSTKSHRALIEEISTKAKINQLASKLGKLKASRHNADYKSEPEITGATAELALMQAKKIIQDLESYT